MFDSNPLAVSMHSVLQPFLCLGCGAFQYRPLCKFCQGQWIARREPMESVLADTPVFALWFGNTITYRAFRQWKLTGSKPLSELLSRIEPTMLARLKSEAFDAVIPIPQDPKRSWNRGFESALEAAQVFADALEIPLIRALSLLPTKTAPKGEANQAMRDRLDRSLSPNPFGMRLELNGDYRLLIVDDVVTTGATVQHAVETLRQQGPRLKIAVGALVFKPPGAKTRAMITAKV